MEVETVIEWPNLSFEGNYTLDLSVFGNKIQGSGKTTEDIKNYANNMLQVINDKGLLTAMEVLIKVESFDVSYKIMVV